ncbi:hypothetical protein [Chondromyces apiculatus]|uniref:Uncharacterized protein n=1 Tax=Chondromyces apiculatus DSM 436 TaxID=1192034 RepID=A0A017SV84_9BACT|nr:hypothetical protein [Chondromyces apiculatus]EYF00206.1 Hypothetical protein CAP_1079 [Chondromyces apiculatus DSM 436]
MKNGTCLKCGSTEVYRHQNGSEVNFRGGVSFRETSCTTYVCTACGYLEQFVNLRGDDPNLVASIQKTWKKAGR